MVGTESWNISVFPLSYFYTYLGGRSTKRIHSTCGLRVPHWLHFLAHCFTRSLPPSYESL